MGDRQVWDGWVGRGRDGSVGRSTRGGCEEGGEYRCVTRQRWEQSWGIGRHDGRRSIWERVGQRPGGMRLGWEYWDRDSGMG